MDDLAFVLVLISAIKSIQFFIIVESVLFVLNDCFFAYIIGSYSEIFGI